MAFPFLLLAAQAAGIGANLYANRQQSRIERMGGAIDEQQMKLRMEQEGLVAQQETLYDLKALQETLASQRAIMGARGQNPSQGSAKTIEQASIRAQKEDERVRGLNKGFRKDYMDSLSRLRRIDRAGVKAQRGTQLLGTSLNMFSFNEMFGGATLQPVKKELNG